MAETSPPLTLSGSPEPEAKEIKQAPSEPSLFKSGWQQGGFITAVMLGQCFNLTPVGAVSL